MDSQERERQKVYAALPATTVVRIGGWYYLMCEGEIRIVPSRKDPPRVVGYG